MNYPIIQLKIKLKDKTVKIKMFHIKHDYNIGKCSNIPLCCILNYIFIWQPLFYIAKFIFGKKGFSYIGWYSNWTHDGSGYVVCPICAYTGKRHKLLHCYDCKKQHNCKRNKL